MAKSSLKGLVFVPLRHQIVSYYSITILWYQFLVSGECKLFT